MRKILILAIVMYGCSQAPPDLNEHAAESMALLKNKLSIDYMLGPDEAGGDVMYAMSINDTDEKLVRLIIISSLSDKGADYTMEWKYNEETGKHEGGFEAQGISNRFSYGDGVLMCRFAIMN